MGAEPVAVRVELAEGVEHEQIGGERRHRRHPACRLSHRKGRIQHADV